jgi:hypothetical protein
MASISNTSTRIPDTLANPINPETINMGIRINRIAKSGSQNEKR